MITSACITSDSVTVTSAVPDNDTLSVVSAFMPEMTPDVRFAVEQFRYMSSREDKRTTLPVRAEMRAPLKEGHGTMYRCDCKIEMRKWITGPSRQAGHACHKDSRNYRPWRHVDVRTVRLTAPSSYCS